MSEHFLCAVIGQADAGGSPAIQTMPGTRAAWSPASDVGRGATLHTVARVAPLPDGLRIRAVNGGQDERPKNTSSTWFQMESPGRRPRLHKIPKMFHDATHICAGMSTVHPAQLGWQRPVRGHNISGLHAEVARTEMLDTRQVRLIVTLAEHGTLVRAGRILGMSPSALTRALSAIEDRLGEPLFDRAKRRFEPTALCRAIIAKGGELLAKADELNAIVTQLSNERSDPLVVSAGPLARDALGGPVFARLQARLPGIQMQMLDGSALDAVRHLFERRAIAAIAEASDLHSPEQLDITPLRRHPMFALVRRDHPLLSLGRDLAPEDVFRFPFAVQSHVPARFASHLSLALVAARADGERPLPFPAIITDDAGMRLSMAAESDVVVASTARGALLHLRGGALALLPWRPDWFATNFAVMRLRGARQTEASRALLECAMEADAETFALARDLMLPGMAPLSETFAVIGRRTDPALAGQPERPPGAVPVTEALTNGSDLAGFDEGCLDRIAG